MLINIIIFLHFKEIKIRQAHCLLNQQKKLCNFVDKNRKTTKSSETTQAHSAKKKEIPKTQQNKTAIQETTKKDFFMM